MLNHFFWSFPTVPLAVSCLIVVVMYVVSFEPFYSTTPYYSCMTI